MMLPRRRGHAGRAWFACACGIMSLGGGLSGAAEPPGTAPAPLEIGCYKAVGGPTVAPWDKAFDPARHGLLLLVGLPQRYSDRGWTRSTELLPDRDVRRARADSGIGAGGGRMRIGLADAAGEPLAGKPVRLEVELNDADLYALVFQ